VHSWYVGGWGRRITSVGQLELHRRLHLKNHKQSSNSENVSPMSFF
jgi:hypothetical protein